MDFKVIPNLHRVQSILDKVTKMSETDEIFYDIIGSNSIMITNTMLRGSEELIAKIRSIKIEPNDHIIDTIKNLKLGFEEKTTVIFENLIKVPHDLEDKCPSTIKKKFLSAENQNSYLLTFGKDKKHLHDFVSPKNLEKKLDELSNDSPSKSIVSSESTINCVGSTKSNDDNTLVNLISNNIFKLEKEDYSETNLSGTSEDAIRKIETMISLSKISPRGSLECLKKVSSKSSLSNDKIVFIKNQIKNPLASFNSFGM